MGFFLNLFKPPTPSKKAPARTSVFAPSVRVPDSLTLTYSGSLLPVVMIDAGGHADPRVLLYAIRCLPPDRVFTAKEFTDYEFSDFGTLNAMLDVLLRKDLIRPLPTAEALRKLYTVNELKELLQERDLPVRGRKDELIERLLGSGFKGYTRRYKDTQYRLTESGTALIAAERASRSEAIESAIRCLSNLNFDGAVAAYNRYDSIWGYVHKSGYMHTIFANYEFPQERFDFLASYPMRELANSDDFKRKLRACLIAGLMRGDQQKESLACDFQQVCDERICCPRIIDLYRQGHDEEDLEDLKPMFENMEENCRSDPQYTLAYYISHVLYLSRR